MAEVVDTNQSIEVGEKTATEDMVLENDEAVPNRNFSQETQSDGGEKVELNGEQPSAKISNGDLKRVREDGGESEEEDGVSKKHKVENSVEEERLENSEQDTEEEEENKSDTVNLGPKDFSSSEGMFNYFYKFLHFWPPNLNVNRYEYMVLLDLLKKGHAEADKKLGGGVNAFQVRYHPMWKSRCFFLIRHDESVDDFSFRKCVDHILPLPDNMKANSDAGKVLGGPHHKGGGDRGGGGGGGRGGRGGAGRRGGHGRGRGGWFRN